MAITGMLSDFPGIGPQMVDRPDRLAREVIPDGGAQRADGVREIHQLDVFEVSATPAPINNCTRVLSTKAVDEFDAVRTKARDDMLALFAAADTGT